MRGASPAASDQFLELQSKQKVCNPEVKSNRQQEETFAETPYVMEQEHILKPLSAFPEKMRPYQVLFI